MTMNAFWGVVLLILNISIGATRAKRIDCQCRPRTPAPVFLQELEGPWYVVAMVNETNPSEYLKCIKMTYTYDYAREVVSVTRSAIHPNSTQAVENSADFGMITPGIIDVTYVMDGVEINYHDHYLEHTPGESFIFTTCQRNDQVIFTDRIALFMSRRDVDDATIAAKYQKIGITLGGNNAYYRVPQTNCTN